MRPDIIGITSHGNLQLTGVANDIGLGVDQYTVLAQQGIPGGLNDFLSMQLLFEDPTGTAFDSDSLLR